MWVDILGLKNKDSIYIHPPMDILSQFYKIVNTVFKISRKNMAKTKFKENFKEILKELRKKKNLTQRGLAEKTGISLAMITKYEQGLNTPSIENLRVLADFFKVSIRNFLEEDRDRDRVFKIFLSEEEASIDIENYDSSTNDKKFLSISKGRQYIYHILKF